MSSWYMKPNSEADIVTSTRIRLARNIKGIPFPSGMTDEQKKMLDKYADLTGNATACLEMSNFIYGFRLGVCLLLDSITGKDED